MTDTARKPFYARAWVIATAVVVVLLIAYLALAAATGNRVPTGTRVAGVDVGGMSATEAKKTLDDAFSDRLAAPLAVTVGDQSGELVPADAGLRVDTAATVKRLTGFTLNPRLVAAHFFGGSAARPTTTVDDDALTDALTTLGDSLAVEPVDANVVFEGGEPSVTEPKDGVDLDVAGARDAVKENFLTADAALDLPVDTTAPKVGKDQLDAVLRDVVEPLTAGPVTVKVGEETAELSVADLTGLASIDVEKNALSLDEDALKDLVIKKAPELGSSGTDAKIVLEGGKPVVVPSKAGRSLDAAELREQVTAAAQSTDKVAEVALSESDADFSTEDAKKLGVKEVVGEFDTPLTADNVRTTNLLVGTKTITNTLVKPGETFSLLEALGPVTKERGFVSSGVVENGLATEALGGGLSQLSTTTMNAAYFSGMDLVTFRQHTRYFSRYPEGREATLWGPSIDMQWKNTTDYGVLVDAYVADGRVHVRLWSTKVYDVKSWTSKRRNITKPQVVYNDKPDCTPENGTTPGFTVDFGRERYKGGELFDTEKWTWTYSAWPIVKCGKAP